MRCLRNIPPSRIEARHSYSFKTGLPAWLYIFGYARTRMGAYIRHRRGGSRRISLSCRSWCAEGNTRAGSDVRFWGVKQTCSGHALMSANDPKRT